MCVFVKLLSVSCFTSVYTLRILRRDERKAVEESYRVRGAGINKAVAKEVTKNPTRVIPDQPGFHGITKLEFKRDTRDIDKRSNLMVSTRFIYLYHSPV